ncbi:MAG: SDR family NAD(P)-dependent oxidoreductase [Leisingera sp.]
MTRFDKKTVLITGGHSGIGFGIAERFAREGADLILVGRNQAKGDAAAAKLAAQGGNARFLTADLSREEDVRGLATGLDRLDVLVNNAGLLGRLIEHGPEDSPGTRWDRIRGANQDSTYLVTAHCLPLLKASGGSVVNISSTATWHGNWGLYGVAKAGVEALTRSFAAEAAPVRVNAVSPGWIANDLAASASGNADGSWDLPPSLLDRMGTPSEIAGAVAFLASEDASFVTGQTLIADGGLTLIDYPSRPLLEQCGHVVKSQD